MSAEPQNSTAYQQITRIKHGIYCKTQDNGTFVGTCSFKSPPQNAEVEIAYFTFPQYEGQGVATQMVRWLTELAEKNGVKRVKAQTLPEKNASTRILEKLGFTFVGPAVHPDDGTIWEWQR